MYLCESLRRTSIRAHYLITPSICSAQWLSYNHSAHWEIIMEERNAEGMTVSSHCLLHFYISHFFLRSLANNEITLSTLADFCLQGEFGCQWEGGMETQPWTGSQNTWDTQTNWRCKQTTHFSLRLFYPMIGFIGFNQVWTVAWCPPGTVDLPVSRVFAVSFSVAMVAPVSVCECCHWLRS